MVHQCQIQLGGLSQAALSTDLKSDGCESIGGQHLSPPPNMTALYYSSRLREYLVKVGALR